MLCIQGTPTANKALDDGGEVVQVDRLADHV